MNEKCKKLVEHACSRVKTVKDTFAKILPLQFLEKDDELVSAMTWGIKLGKAETDLLRYRAGIKVLYNLVTGKSDDEQLVRALLNQAITSLDDAMACSAAA